MGVKSEAQILYSIHLLELEISVGSLCKTQPTPDARFATCLWENSQSGYFKLNFDSVKNLTRNGD